MDIVGDSVESTDIVGLKCSVCAHLTNLVCDELDVSLEFEGVADYTLCYFIYGIDDNKCRVSFCFECKIGYQEMDFESGHRYSGEKKTSDQSQVEKIGDDVMHDCESVVVFRFQTIKAPSSCSCTVTNCFYTFFYSGAHET